MLRRCTLCLKSRSSRHPQTVHKVKIAGKRSMCKFAYITYGRHTRLRETHPEIAAEWDYDKNPRHLHPAIVINTTVQPLWWKCSLCSKSFCLSLDRRTVLGKGCPYCSSSTVITNPPQKDDLLEGEVNPLFLPQDVDLHGAQPSHPEYDKTKQRTPT